MQADAASRSSTRQQLDQTPSACHTYGQAPDFTGTQDWFNTPDGESLSMSDLRGKVVLIDFWTYTCINCIRTLPYLEAWQQRYGRDGFTVVGVHSPEFPFEKDAGNVQAAIRQNDLTYPVVQDNDLATWNAWGNQYWPAEYLVDAQGNVRDAHFGEGDYDETERAIRTLLQEAGHAKLGSGARASAQAPSAGATTPETYLGAARAQGLGERPRSIPATRTSARPPAAAPVNQFAYAGDWGITDEDATSGAGARDRPRVQRPPGLPRARLARPRAPRPGPPRRQADPGQARRRGRPAGPDDDRGAAPLPARRPAGGRAAPALADASTRGSTGYAFTFG